MLPKISIITPSFNQGHFIEETILSVIGQGYPRLEFFIIDGGSTDDTVDIIKKYEKDITCWLSEKDNGQSDAIIKGLAMATGDVITWINSDDLLAEGSLHKIAEIFSLSDCYAVAGSTRLFGNIKERIMPPSFLFDDTRQKALGRFNFNQPGTFYHRKALEKMGTLNSKLHFVMDKEWWNRFLINVPSEKIVTIEDTLSYFRIHEGAKSSSSNKKFDEEYAQILLALAALTCETEAVSLLKERFKDCKPFPIELSFYQNIKKEEVYGMIAFFLLKLSYRIYQQGDFDFGKKLYSEIKWKNTTPDKFQIQFLNCLRNSVKSKTWLIFRIRRKFCFIN